MSTTASLTVVHVVKLKHREVSSFAGVAHSINMTVNKLPIWVCIYDSIQTPGLRLVPTLALPHGGPAAFVSFPERLVALSIIDGVDYEHVVSLKSSATNRIIGTGTSTLGIRQAGENVDKPVVLKVLTTASGVLEIELNSTELHKSLWAPCYSVLRHHSH